MDGDQRQCTFTPIAKSVEMRDDQEWMLNPSKHLQGLALTSKSILEDTRIIEPDALKKHLKTPGISESIAMNNDLSTTWTSRTEGLIESMITGPSNPQETQTWCLGWVLISTQLSSRNNLRNKESKINTTKRNGWVEREALPQTKDLAKVQANCKATRPRNVRPITNWRMVAMATAKAAEVPTMRLSKTCFHDQRTGHWTDWAVADYSRQRSKLLNSMERTSEAGGDPTRNEEWLNFFAIVCRWCRAHVDQSWTAQQQETNHAIKAFVMMKALRNRDDRSKHNGQDTCCWFIRSESDFHSF